MSSILKNYQMKTAPISQTHFNSGTPYYLADTPTQTFTNVVATNITSTNLKVTGNVDVSGAVVVSDVNMNGHNITNSNLLPSQTVFSYDSGAIVVASPIPAGYNAVNVGSPITVAKTGLYILSGTYGINVNETDAAVFGATDDIGVTLVPTPPVPGVNPVAIDFHPYSMPTTPTGTDYGSQSSMTVKLTSGVTYQPKYWTDNVGGTMSVPNNILAMQMTLSALC